MDMKAAHQFSSKHRSQIEESSICGCFYCLAIFPPSEIDDWWDDEQTATCPTCGIDAVIGSASGAPITSEFLGEMNRHWF